MDKLYSVEDLALTCDTTPRAVRLYVEKGLLDPMRAGRAYVFTQISVQKLDIILRCKRIGMSLEEIKARLYASTTSQMKDIIERIETIRTDASQELDMLCEELDHMRRQERS